MKYEAIKRRSYSNILNTQHPCRESPDTAERSPLCITGLLELALRWCNILLSSFPPPFDLHQGFSVSALLIFGLDNSLLWGAALYIMSCSSIPSLLHYTLISSPSAAETAETIPRYGKVSLRGQTCSQFRTTVPHLDKFFGLILDWCRKFQDREKIVLCLGYVCPLEAHVLEVGFQV